MVQKLTYLNDETEIANFPQYQVSSSRRSRGCGGRVGGGLDSKGKSRFGSRNKTRLSLTFHRRLSSAPLMTFYHPFSFIFFLFYIIQYIFIYLSDPYGAPCPRAVVFVPIFFAELKIGVANASRLIRAGRKYYASDVSIE